MAKSYRAILQYAEEQSNFLDAEMPFIQRNILRELTALVKTLDTDASGNIKQTASNLKKIASVKRINRIIVNSIYKKRVSEFVKSFDISAANIKDLITKLPNARV